MKEKYACGLDIGTSTVKLVKLRFAKEQVELCNFYLEPVQPDLGPVLKGAYEACDTKKVNISVSGPVTVIRYATFLKMRPEELKQALKFEAAKHIPFSIDEVNLDSCILKEDLTNNKMLVLLAAVKKDFLSQRLKLIQDIGFNADIVDIDSIALINAFNFNYPEAQDSQHAAVALLNIGASISNLNILEDGIPRLSRDMHISGNNFTQKLADTLPLDFKSAENLKLNPEKEKLQSIVACLEPVFNNLANEIRVSFDYYESQSASSVAKIFLSGGGSQFGSLKDTLSNLLGIEVEHWDPLKKISLSDSVDSKKLKGLSSHLAVAIGLSLRG